MRTLIVAKNACKAIEYAKKQNLSSCKIWIEPDERKLKLTLLKNPKIKVIYLD